MVWSRRHFLLFLGASAAVAPQVLPKATAAQGARFSDFSPIAYPLPLPTDKLTPAQQQRRLAQFTVADDLVLPQGFGYEILAQWGDPLGEGWFGYNNDYLGLVETEGDRAWLTVNFEYISLLPWRQGYEAALGRALPFEAVQTALAPQNGAVNAFALPETDPLKAQIRLIAEAGLLDLGVGVVPLGRTVQGSWQKQDAPQARRITGLSGYKGGRYLTATGPGAAVFSQKEKQGYDDGLGNQIIGTFANCAGGTTPWGTVLSAEENFQDQTPEAVYADGSAVDPGALPFKLTEKSLEGLGNVFGLAGNKYGWMVEIDPSNPQDYGVKHTWLGRFRHEAVSVRAEAGQPLAVYSGCDRRSGHFYKFVSAEKVDNPQDKGNSRLFGTGRLYGARFNPDGTGDWIALEAATPVQPILPSQIAATKPEEAVVYLPHRDRTQPGPEAFFADQAVQDYGRRFQTLGDLYPAGNPQGAILIDAHLAANAAGVTPTARPEDTELLPDGSVVVAFTSGWPDPEDGGCDRRIFKGPQGETPYECGWILKLREEDNRPEARRFRWQILAAGGEPQQGGLGFSNPDNLALDGFGDLWMVTDISTSKLNRPFQRRQESNSLETVGAFGNNSLWYLPLRGPQRGQALPFALGPMESELTGPVFSRDQQTLFLAVQHPGEAKGTRKDGASQTGTFPLTATNGDAFNQERTVPQGSNWPSGQANQPPRPAVTMIRRLGT